MYSFWTKCWCLLDHWFLRNESKCPEKVRWLSFICKQRGNVIRANTTNTWNSWKPKEVSTFLTAFSDSHLWLPDVTILNLKNLTVKWKQAGHAVFFLRSKDQRGGWGGGPVCHLAPKEKICLKLEIKQHLAFSECRS